MERGSDKHSPRLDEGLQQEVAPLVRGHGDEGRTDYRSKETPGDEEIGLGRRPEVDDPQLGLTEDDLAHREELARHLLPHVFPAHPVELLAAARDEHAPPPVLDALDRLPERLYDNVQDVWTALGGPVETRF